MHEWLWAQCDRAARDWFRLQCQNICASFYLWHQPGGLAVAMDKPEGFELATGEALARGCTIEQQTARILGIARRLPILPPELL